MGTMEFVVQAEGSNEERRRSRDNGGNIEGDYIGFS
jgi:hypothetical protein